MTSGAPETHRTPWVDDVLGPDYQASTLALPDDDEGPVVATLVRHRPPSREDFRNPAAVLYVHGWSDYFFQTELAEFWTGHGVAFYALDLRKYGRSLRDHQTPGYVDDLKTYDAELDAAVAMIRTELGAGVQVMAMGHSTGGLVLSLWAHRNPGAVRGLVLSSPWLELQGSAVARYLTAPAVEGLARLDPRRPLPNVDPGYYARSLRELEVAQDVNPAWRPVPSMAVRPGWLRAITNGHGEVADGLSIDVPVLVMASARTHVSARWTEAMLRTDIVLDVETIARRAVQLGSVVTVVRFEGAIHDLVLSAPDVRGRVYAEITRWALAYGWD